MNFGVLIPIICYGCLFFLLFMIVLYLYCIKPGVLKDGQMEPFLGIHYAHRGFYDHGPRDEKGRLLPVDFEKENITIIPENSLAAYRRAIEHGFGIELDVQLTSDGKLVVHHDKTLKRMCQVNKDLHDCTYEELQTYSLRGTKERIPLFEDVLKVIEGKVPLVIEVKDYFEWENVVTELVKYTDSYDGDYMVVSFSSLVLGWFRKNRPDVVRGQITQGRRLKNGKKKYLKSLPKSFLLFNVICRPQILSYNVNFYHNFSYAVCRKLFRVHSLHWPTHSEEELHRFQSEKDLYVFEWFEPAFPRITSPLP